MQRITPLFLALVFLAATGCGPKQPAISDLQRKQAAALVSEAEFALALRDFARAEGLFREAAGLCPDNGAYWLQLGTTSKRLNKTAEAKKSYEQAAKACAAAYKANDKDPGPVLRQVYAYALLGRTDDARALLRKVRKAHPKDEEIQGFDEATLDRMIADPGFKAMAI